MRGRNVDWADRAVREGASLSATEAQTRLRQLLQLAQYDKRQYTESIIRNVRDNDALGDARCSRRV